MSLGFAGGGKNYNEAGGWRAFIGRRDSGRTG